MKSIDYQTARQMLKPELRDGFDRMAEFLAGSQIYFPKSVIKRKDLSTVKRLIDSGLPKNEVTKIVKMRFGVCYNTARKMINDAKQ